MSEYIYINIDKSEVSSIEVLNTDKKYCFNIENGANVEVLKTLNLFLRKNKISKVSFNFSNYPNIPDSYIKGIKGLKYLYEATNISLFPKTSGNSIDNLIMLDNLIKLEKFTLIGTYKNSISLEPLLKFREYIRYINIERGLNKKQQSIINQCFNIEHLEVKELDLQTFNIKEKLKELYINTNLHGMSLLSTTFPILEKLFLKNCKSTLDINSLKNAVSLTKLYLFDLYAIEEFPKLAPLPKLEELYVIMPDLKKIDNIWDLENLKTLALMNLKEIHPKDFKEIGKLKKLKNAYITFVNKEYDLIIEQLITEKGLRYNM